MAHIRMQVRDAAVTALTGLVTTGANVWSGRISPMKESDMPGLIVFLNVEDGQPDAMGMMRRDGHLRIEGVAIGNDDLIDTLDQIAAEVEAAIIASADLGGLLMGEPDPPSTRIVIDEPQNGGARRTGSVLIDYPIQYRTSLGDPGTQL